MKKCNRNIQNIIQLSEEMLKLSDKGDIDRNDDSCGVLYGVARDAAYRILDLARQEKEKHKESGKWE